MSDGYSASLYSNYLLVFLLKNLGKISLRMLLLLLLLLLPSALPLSSPLGKVHSYLHHQSLSDSYFRLSAAKRLITDESTKPVATNINSAQVIREKKAKLNKYQEYSKVILFTISSLLILLTHF